jgi:Cysteine-rich CWC
MNGSSPCPCASVTLTPTKQAQLRQQFSGCLCLRCLQQLAAADQAERLSSNSR